MTKISQTKGIIRDKYVRNHSCLRFFRIEAFDVEEEEGQVEASINF